MKRLIIPMAIIFFLTSCTPQPKEQRLAQLTRSFYEIPDFFKVEVIGIDIANEVLDKDYNCFEYALDINLRAKEDLLTLRPEKPFGKYRIRTTRGEEFIPITNTKVKLEEEIRYYEEQIDQVALIKQCIRMRGKRCLKYRRIKASRNHKEKIIGRKIATTKKFFPHPINKHQNTIIEKLPIIVCQNKLTKRWN